jgi:hypothetical protein
MFSLLFYFPSPVPGSPSMILWSGSGSLIYLVEVYHNHRQVDVLIMQDIEA